MRRYARSSEADTSDCMPFLCFILKPEYGMSNSSGWLINGCCKARMKSCTRWLVYSRISAAAVWINRNGCLPAGLNESHTLFPSMAIVNSFVYKIMSKELLMLLNYFLNNRIHWSIQGRCKILWSCKWIVFPRSKNESKRKSTELCGFLCYHDNL